MAEPTRKRSCVGSRMGACAGVGLSPWRPGVRMVGMLHNPICGCASVPLKTVIRGFNVRIMRFRPPSIGFESSFQLIRCTTCYPHFQVMVLLGLQL